MAARYCAAFATNQLRFTRTFKQEGVQRCLQAFARRLSCKIWRQNGVERIFFAHGLSDHPQGWGITYALHLLPSPLITLHSSERAIVEQAGGNAILDHQKMTCTECHSITG